MNYCVSLKNKIIKKRIDHIVYTVSNLETTVLEFEKKLGVQAIFGGYHKTQGTKNALINLSDECYLELLASDPTNTKIKPPRWMGVDLLTKDQITRFALKSNTLEKDSHILQQYNPNMGVQSAGSRNAPDGSLLTWELTMPLATPEVEIIPFMIDWSKSDMHPTNYLPDMRCTLKALHVTHPKPEKLQELYKRLACEIEINKAEEVSLKMIIDSPNGPIEL